MRVPFTHSLGSLFSPARRMREDWDLRARENARYYIECGHAGSDEDFWSSGRRDLDDLILRGLEVDRSAAVLEIGCGIGRVLKPFSERVASATGVDISGEMVRRGTAALAGRPNVRLARTDGDLPDVPDASLDLVYSHIVFQHVPSRAAVSKYFREAARVLKGAGVFRFQVDGRRPPRFRPPNTWRGVRYEAAELRRELDAVGFDVVETTGEGTHYLWVTARRRPGAGRPETSAVHVESRSWDREALDGLLRRIGRDPSLDGPRVEAGSVSLRELSRGLLARHRFRGARDFVAGAYRALLGREPDAGGLDFYASQIERGGRRADVLDCLLSSAELDRTLRPLAVSTRASGSP
jgi:SAM-dependent methyltransferase